MNAQEAPYRAHQVEDHWLQASSVAQKFHIKVLQPFSRVEGTERFPVLYTTDSDEFFGSLSTMAKFLQLCGETPRFILVGIGYGDTAAAGLLRRRDLYPHAVRALFQEYLAPLAASALVGGVQDLKTITDTTDAKDFLQFIEQELMPFIAARYPVLRGENSYFGYSAGAAFGLYTLFTRPTTFKRYILGSPSTSHRGQNFGIELASAFIRSGQPINAKVFMSVGELEEFRDAGPSEFVTGYYRLAKFLKDAAIPGLDLSVRVFGGETHATAWPLAFNTGVKALLGPAAEVPFAPQFPK